MSLKYDPASVPQVRQTAGTQDLFTPGGEPRIDRNGTLSFSLAQDSNGRATFEVVLADDGIPAPETSHPALFALEVEQVNQAPVFCLTATSLTITEDVPFSHPAFFSSVSPGGSTLNPTP